MTTAASFPSLHAPLADDNMEMSSPARSLYDDDDIDIDFDEHIGGVELTDDDRMADDTEQPRPGTATDDMMEDDAPVQNAEAPEQEMQDDFDPAAYEQGDPDDELIDYDDEDYEVKEQTAYETAAPEITLQDREPTDFDEPVDEEIIREPETAAPAQEVLVEASAPEVVTAVLDTSAPEVTAASIADESFAEAVEDSVAHNGVDGDANAAADDVNATTDDQQRETTPVVDPVEEPFPELPEDSPELKAAASIPAPIETHLDAGNDAPATPTDTGLHPMFVVFEEESGNWEWPLFKSRKQPEGLLKDDNLASVALADLLNSCRSRLALKIGEDVSEEQEFVLRFDSINLTIVENSPSAFNTSLDEILAVFRQLYVNDGAQSIPPFWIHLSLQINPSRYLTLLKQAAAVGQGISRLFDVSAEDVTGQEHEGYDQGGYEDPTLLGDSSGFENEGEAQANDDQPHAETELDETNHHEYENTEGGQEEHDGYDQSGQYDEVQQAGFGTHQEFGAQQAEDETQQAVQETQQSEFEASEDNEGQHADVAAEYAEGANDAQQFEVAEDREDTSYVVADDAAVDPNHEVEPSVAASTPVATQITVGDARDGEEEAQDTAKTSNVESAASSTTLREDQASDAVGNHSEYKGEDLIDWNDTLTRRPSETAADDADDADDFSNFLAENDLQESADVETTNKENTHTSETDNTNVATGDENDNAADGNDDKIDFEDDNFERLAEDADQHAPAEAVEGVANGEAQEQPETQASANGVAEPISELLATPEANQPQTEVLPSKEPVRNDEDYIDFDDEDGIDFDDDTFEEHEARKASEANSPGSKSPSGKRPLDEAGDDEQPELKKVKSS